MVVMKMINRRQAGLREVETEQDHTPDEGDDHAQHPVDDVHEGAPEECDNAVGRRAEEIGQSSRIALAAYTHGHAEDAADRRDLNGVADHIETGVVRAGGKGAEEDKEEHLRQRHEDLRGCVLGGAKPVEQGDVGEHGALPEETEVAGESFHLENHSIASVASARAL